MNIFYKIYTKLFPLKAAIKGGMKVGKGVSIVSPLHTNFGTEPYLITLGNYVRISGDVLFTTHDGGTWAFRNQEQYKGISKFGRISIGDYTFIGARSMIMPGVKIGAHCVIGACSLVTKDVPDGMVVGGVPAKIICTTEQYAEKCKNSMPEGWLDDNSQMTVQEKLLKYYPELSDR